MRAAFASGHGVGFVCRFWQGEGFKVGMLLCPCIHVMCTYITDYNVVTWTDQPRWSNGTCLGFFGVCFFPRFPETLPGWKSRGTEEGFGFCSVSIKRPLRDIFRPGRAVKCCFLMFIMVNAIFNSAWVSTSNLLLTSWNKELVVLYRNRLGGEELSEHPTWIDDDRSTDDSCRPL